MYYIGYSQELCNVPRLLLRTNDYTHYTTVYVQKYGDAQSLWEQKV